MSVEGRFRLSLSLGEAHLRCTWGRARSGRAAVGGSAAAAVLQEAPAPGRPSPVARLAPPLSGLVPPRLAVTATPPRLLEPAGPPGLPTDLAYPRGVGLAVHRRAALIELAALGLVESATVDALGPPPRLAARSVAALLGLPFRQPSLAAMALLAAVLGRLLKDLPRYLCPQGAVDLGAAAVALGCIVVSGSWESVMKVARLSWAAGYNGLVNRAMVQCWSGDMGLARDPARQGEVESVQRQLKVLIGRTCELWEHIGKDLVGLGLGTAFAWQGSHPWELVAMLGLMVANLVLATRWKLYRGPQEDALRVEADQLRKTMAAAHSQGNYGPSVAWTTRNAANANGSLRLDSQNACFPQAINLPRYALALVSLVPTLQRWSSLAPAARAGLVSRFLAHLSLSEALIQLPARGARFYELWAGLERCVDRLARAAVPLRSPRTCIQLDALTISWRAPGAATEVRLSARAATSLILAPGRRPGRIWLTGSVGSGKTSLLCLWRAALAARAHLVVAEPRVLPDGMLVGSTSSGETMHLLLSEPELMHGPHDVVLGDELRVRFESHSPDAQRVETLLSGIAAQRLLVETRRP